MNQSSEILTGVFERSTDAFVAPDTHCCYTYGNKKAREIFQRNPAEMIGKHIWTAFAAGIDHKEEPGRKLIIQKVKEAIEPGKPLNEELKIVTVKNNIRWKRTI